MDNELTRSNVHVSLAKRNARSLLAMALPLWLFGAVACGDDDDNPEGAAGASGSGGSAGTAGTGASGGSAGSGNQVGQGGSGAVGGMGGCTAGQFLADFTCGRVPDSPGAPTCQLRPETCDGDYKPVCGCDGNVYSNECEANRAGVSFDWDGFISGGACAPPDGYFGCSSIVCAIGTQVCATNHDEWDINDVCVQIPDGCNAGDLCNCAADAACPSGVSSCEEDQQTGAVFHCEPGI